jgi:transposase
MDGLLFDKGPSERPVLNHGAQQQAGMPRLRVPQRDQVEMQLRALEELLEPDHRARLVWQAVAGLDLSRWLDQIKAVEGHVGRDATDPRVLVALWVLATLDGVGSARELDRLCKMHVAYQWICGGVSVNYHLLANFRSQHGEKWDALMTQIVAALLAEGLVTMKRVAQDGMRVRAQAGKSSFRRQGRLNRFLDEARQQVEALKQLDDESAHELTQRQRAARERAAAERAQRIEQAVRHCEELQAQREARADKNNQQAKQARASTTDPEARVMQFSDGGYRPGYNVQFSTDTEAGVIVGVDVTNVGNDSEQLPPMLRQLDQRYGQMPDEALVDGGFASLSGIEEASLLNCTVYAPLKDEEKQLAAGKDPYAKKKGDSPAVAAWRGRMGTAVGKALYRLRCRTAEWVNALARNRGFYQVPLRGQAKCRTVAVLYAITHNLMQGMKLRTEREMATG